MKLEDQVCSLDLAKRLKELGVKQESLFYWKVDGCLPNGDDFHALDCYAHPDGMEDSDYDEDNWYSAFTVAELGEMLPKYIQQGNFEYYYTQLPSKHCINWVITYRASFTSWDGNDQEDVNEANCRAKMLIHLIENGHVKP